MRYVTHVNLRVERWSKTDVSFKRKGDQKYEMKEEMGKMRRRALTGVWEAGQHRRLGDNTKVI